MVIDSHVLLWWFAGAEALSANARHALSGIGGSGAEFIVSPVTFWEFRLKEIRGLLVPNRPVREWPEVLRRIGNIRLEDVDPEIWLLSAELDWDHRDPADRIIAATALIHGVPVLTKDRVFHKKGCPVKAVW